MSSIQSLNVKALFLHKPFMLHQLIKQAALELMRFRSCPQEIIFVYFVVIVNQVFISILLILLHPAFLKLLNQINLLVDAIKCLKNHMIFFKFNVLGFFALA